MKRPAHQRHLRTQLSFSMAFTAVTSLAIFIVGMVIFYINLQQRWVAGLSPSNQEALKTLLDQGKLDNDTLVTLVNAFSLSWSNGYSTMEFATLIGFVILSLICSVTIGIYASRRLSRPIEAVTDAAKQVSAGVLNLQVDQALGTSIEARDLLLSFNHMTNSLEQAERDATESAAVIAHELRTPLTVLRGRLQGLSDGAFQPTPAMLAALLGQVDTLSSIVDDLGMLSRLSTGRFELETRNFDLAELVSSVLTSVSPGLRSEGIELTHDLPSVPLCADPARIRQALNALINNAMRYGRAGRYICVETAIEGSMASLRVIDHGPGIPARDHNRVFDRWWRAEASRSRLKGGGWSGLVHCEGDCSGSWGGRDDIGCTKPYRRLRRYFIAALNALSGSVQQKAAAWRGCYGQLHPTFTKHPQPYDKYPIVMVP